MRRLVIPLVFGMALISISISTFSSPWGWLVQKTSGSAVYSTGMTQLAVKKGVVLDRGATVRTGANGKVLLVRSEESVFIGPYTVAAIAAHPTPGMKTTVLLQSGQANLAVEKQSRVHFSVETPYLVAVVKGTRFQVSVAPLSAEVSVQEGRVGVKALKSGLTADVLAGQKAVVDAAGNLRLSGRGRLAQITKGIPRTAAVASAGSSTSTNFSSNVSVGTAGVSVNGGASIGGASIGAGAGIGGASASVGAGASVGGIGAGVGASTGSGGASVGGGLSLGGKSLGGSLGIGGL